VILPTCSNMALSKDCSS